MRCLFHGDYGPPDPIFAISGSVTAVHNWAVDPDLLKQARNIGEAEAIQRHVLRGESISWCHQGYSWVDQNTIGWFYIAASVFVAVPYFLMKIKIVRRRVYSRAHTMNWRVGRSSWLRLCSRSAPEHPEASRIPAP
jgi:hypothetical protein